MADPDARFTHQSPRARARLGLRYVREWLGDSPVFLPIVMLMTPTGLTRRLTPDTQIVIEGFPRSGNTFALHALRLAEAAAGREVVIKSHVHVPAQVALATRRGLPTLYVIREPVHTVASLIVAAAHVPIRHALREYTHHHEQVFAYRKGFVVGEFREITSDYAAVIRRVNERFGTSFALFEQTPENVDAVFREIEVDHQRVHQGREAGLPRPSSGRDPVKSWLVEQIGHPQYRAELADAQAIYEEFLRLV